MNRLVPAEEELSPRPVGLRLKALSAGHGGKAFICGVEALDMYLLKQATQDARRRASACYVAVEEGSNKAAGYFTLAAGGVPLTNLSQVFTKRLPRYPLARH